MNDSELTPHQRAKNTRQKNDAIRKEQRAARAKLEEEDKDRVARCMRKILDDPNSTAAQMIFAVQVLHDIDWTFPIPCGAAKVFEGKVDKSSFGHACKVLFKDYQEHPDTDRDEDE